MRVLVIGSSGMLGHVLTYRLEEQGFEVSDLSYKQPLRRDSVQLDVLDQESFKRFLDGHSYDAIINCVALLNSACDQHPSAAVLLNAWFPHFLEERFQNSKTKIIQISTDAVFSPRAGRFSPADVCNPDTFYGQTKLTGELNNAKDLTIRSAFWGPDWRTHGGGLMNWFLHSTGTVRGYQNVFFNGVTSLECAEFIIEAIQKNYAGIYQLAAQDDISKGTLLMRMKSEFKMPHIQIVPDTTLVSTRCLADTRAHAGRTFGQMLSELKKWMTQHPKLYSHYQSTTNLDWQVSDYENDSDW